MRLCGHKRRASANVLPLQDGVHIMSVVCSLVLPANWRFWRQEGRNQLSLPYVLHLCQAGLGNVQGHPTKALLHEEQGQN